MAFFSDIDCSRPDGVVLLLNKLYAFEIVTAFQYWRHANDVRGMLSSELGDLFEAHAEESMGHADRLRDQIKNLDGRLMNELTSLAQLSPTGDVKAAPSSKGMIALDLDGESASIQMYKEACAMMIVHDPGTHQILAEILNEEYEHRTDLKNLLDADGMNF